MKAIFTSFRNVENNTSELKKQGGSDAEVLNPLSLLSNNHISHHPSLLNIPSQPTTNLPPCVLFFFVSSPPNPSIYNPSITCCKEKATKNSCSLYLIYLN